MNRWVNVAFDLGDIDHLDIVICIVIMALCEEIFSNIFPEQFFKTSDVFNQTVDIKLLPAMLF